jgi:hypothetical protein
MKRQSATAPKKRGPPATGKGEPILVRLQPDLEGFVTLRARVGVEVLPFSVIARAREHIEPQGVDSPESGRLKKRFQWPNSLFERHLQPSVLEHCVKRHRAP